MKNTILLLAIFFSFLYATSSVASNHPSTSDQTTAANWQVLPSPGLHELHIFTSQGCQDEVTIQVIASNQQEVLTIPWQTQGKKSSLQLDTRHLQPGTYWVVVKKNGQVLQQAVVTKA